MIEGPEEKKATTCQEAGARGGRQTKARYGREYYERLGHQAGTTTARRYGREHFRELGRMGAAARTRNQQKRAEEDGA